MPAPFTIATPWDAPVMQRLNGRHPLPISLIADTPEFRFTSALQPDTDESVGQTMAGGRALVQALHDMAPGGLDEATRVQFVGSRHPESQIAMSTPADLLFLHSAPMTFAHRPWVLHVETLLPMFEPFLGHFRSWDVDLHRQPVYYMVRHLVRQPNCRGILTHVLGTHDDLPRLFQDEALAAKVYYAPLGLDLDAATRQLADAAITRKNARQPQDELTILFTNSWRDLGNSFYKRGGLETVMGFLSLVEQAPKARLIMRTSLPADMNPDLLAGLRSHPRIELHEGPVSDAQLFDMLARADVFLLPSANLHTISILRAMAFGAVVVTTDVLAIEEFVTHDRTGIVLKAREGVTWRRDAALGFLHERAEGLSSINMPLAQDIAATLRRLMEDPGLALRLRREARLRVDTAHAMGPWREGFHAMLRAALAPRPPAA